VVSPLTLSCDVREWCAGASSHAGTDAEQLTADSCNTHTEVMNLVMHMIHSRDDSPFQKEKCGQRSLIAICVLP